VLGLQFNSVLLGPSLVSGIAQAGLYGLIAVALVLTYRVSRTVAFVHGGLAIVGALFYWYLVNDLDRYDGSQPRLHPIVGFLVVLALGAMFGALYGLVVTGRRMADWPKITLTTFSLGVMLLMTGVITLTLARAFDAPAPRSPFGGGTVKLFGFVATVHQMATIAVIAVATTILGLVLARTRGGIYVRALADDVEASRWVGVPLHLVGTAVYAGAGALAAMAGALIAPTLGPNMIDVFFVFLRALSAAVMGGFGSFGLAFAGALFFGIADSSLRTGLLGESTPGQRELVTIAVVLIAVIALNRYRKNLIEVLDAEGM
jgi:branched-subunit amino acid ABC-type transport system permease component